MSRPRAQLGPPVPFSPLSFLASETVMRRRPTPASRCRALRAGVMPLALILASAARTVVAQDVVPNTAAALEVRKQYTADLDTLQSKFLALADAFPADKYAWRPMPGVRSVGEVFMHVASEFYVYAPIAYGARPSPLIARTKDGFQKFELMSSKPEVLKHLKDSFEYTHQALGGLDAAAITGTHKLFGADRTIIETSFDMTDDLHEHLGQLIAYARMNGVKPPWTH